MALLVQPSSAAAERVFSLLESSFSQRQSSALEDYISLSVMLQYNNMQSLTLIIVYRIVVIMHSLLFNESLFFSLFYARIMGLLMGIIGLLMGIMG